MAIKRDPDESWEDYQGRRALEKVITKRILAGRFEPTRPFVPEPPRVMELGKLIEQQCEDIKNGVFLKS